MADALLLVCKKLESLRPLLAKKATFVRGVGNLKALVLEAYRLC